MDVLTALGEKIDREALGLPPRGCLICGKPTAGCARSRAHSVELLRARTNEILSEALDVAYANDISVFAARALLYEVCTTPKPGLVDCADSGSHADMDIFTFMNSISALQPYFRACAAAGLSTREYPPQETFARLQQLGMEAEGVMLEATGGVNTHKGAIFSLGILCGALGRVPYTQRSDYARVLDECAAMTAGITDSAYRSVTLENARTNGERFYVKYGLTGVRGQAEKGFPAVRAALPVLRDGIRSGLSLNDAGAAVLLHLIAADDDTNLIARGSREKQLEIRESLSELLAQTPYPPQSMIESLNRSFIVQRLSPGGSADLLAMCYLLWFVTKSAEPELQTEE